MASLFSDAKIINKAREMVSLELFSTADKKIGIYFSAHWCPPCRDFTPVLAEFYNAVKTPNFEIIFVSSDQCEDGFFEYFDSMPWLALDFSESGKKDELSETFNVEGIPTLVIVDGTGKVLEQDANDTVEQSGYTFPSSWK